MSDQIRKNRDLDNPDVKNAILKFVMSKKFQTRDSPQILTSEAQLDQIKNGDYLVYPKFFGAPCWIIFFRQGNDYFAVNFLKTNSKKFDRINIYPLDLQVTEDFYLGTIMEGIFTVFGEKKGIIVSDMYMFAGQTQIQKRKCDRLNYLTSLLQTKVNLSKNYFLHAVSFYPIDRSMGDLFEKIKINPSIQDIVFEPNNYYGGTIFYYTITTEDKLDKIISYSTFTMRKTGTTDVYFLYNSVGEKVDLAYIPTFEISKMCKRWFSGKTKELLVNCKMDSDNNKWVPESISS